MSSRRPSPAWSAVVALGVIVAFAATLLLGLKDLEFAAATHPAGAPNADRNQVIGSFVAYGLGTAVVLGLAGTSLMKSTHPLPTWWRCNVVAGALALVGLGSILPFYCVAVYFDNLILRAPQATGVIPLVALALSGLWLASEITRVAMTPTLRRPSARARP